jgi:cytosine/adenosine deaminase-related metal-dependent hydrolase
VHRAVVFNAATLGGCRFIRRDDLGRLAPGAKGDILLIDLDHMPRRSRMIRTRAGQRMVIALVTLLLDSLVSEIAPVASMITIT